METCTTVSTKHNVLPPAGRPVPIMSGDMVTPSSLDVKFVLERIARSWGTRARVKHEELDLTFDADCADFLPSLLPFNNHPGYETVDDAVKSQILSCGWIAYNEKTVAIETVIVSPSCIHVLDEQIPGLADELSKQIVCETMVDEAYHLLLVKNANRITRTARGLEKLRIPQFNLVKRMNAHQACYSDEWKKRIIQFATTIVSEIFVSDYLNLLADNRTIQPLNRATVDAHRRDELTHSKIFRSLAKCFYTGLSSEQKSFFAEVLPKPVLWFADPELEIWLAILDQLGVRNARTIIADCESMHGASLQRLDYSGIVELAKEIGILDSAIGRESFERHGLL